MAKVALYVVQKLEEKEGLQFQPHAFDYKPTWQLMEVRPAIFPSALHKIADLGLETRLAKRSADGRRRWE